MYIKSLLKEKSVNKKFEYNFKVNLFFRYTEIYMNGEKVTRPPEHVHECEKGKGGT